MRLLEHVLLRYADETLNGFCYVNIPLDYFILLFYYTCSSNTNLAKNLEIACLSSPDHKCYTLRFGFWGTLDISSGRRVTVFGLPSDTERHRTNARLITWQKKKQYSFLWVVADFPLDFPIVFTVSITMIRLRYIIESCQSFQTVLFSGLRNILLQLLRIVGRVCSEGSRIIIDYNKEFGLTKSPLFRASCIDQASFYLEGAEKAPLRAFTKQWSPAGHFYRPKASNELYSAIILSVQLSSTT